MRHPGRKIMALLAIVAGLLLGVFEAVSVTRSSTGEMWFWSIVAALLTVLGIAQLTCGEETKK
jgi:hypothetical protein